MGTRLLNPNANEQETGINDVASLAAALHGINDSLSQHTMMYKEVMNHLTKTRQKALIVDVDRSTASNTILQLPLFQGNIMVIQAVIYSVPAAATLNIGKRSIPIPSAGVAALPFSPAGMIVYPQDIISLTIAAAGAMFLEVIAEQMPPDDERRIVRG